jgi:hypothetical protein
MPTASQAEWRRAGLIIGSVPPFQAAVLLPPHRPPARRSAAVPYIGRMAAGTAAPSGPENGPGRRRRAISAPKAPQPSDLSFSADAVSAANSEAALRPIRPAVAARANCCCGPGSRGLPSHCSLHRPDLRVHCTPASHDGMTGASRRVLRPGRNLGPHCRSVRAPARQGRIGHCLRVPGRRADARPGRGPGPAPGEGAGGHGHGQRRGRRSVTGRGPKSRSRNRLVTALARSRRRRVTSHGHSAARAPIPGRCGRRGRTTGFRALQVSHESLPSRPVGSPRLGGPAPPDRDRRGG